MSVGVTEEAFVDYYEFLMVSPTADRAMIEWAVRLLAARYGKKNGQFVDEERYNQVREAYRTLVDPQKREEYNRKREDLLAAATAQAAAGAPVVAAQASQLPPARVTPIPKPQGDARRDPNDIRIELSAEVEDVLLERRKRQALMSAVYDILVRRPRNPELGRAEIARTIGVGTDELEATIWYCREKDLLKTTNAGLYAITSAGVDWVENGGLPHLTPSSEHSAEAASAPEPDEDVPAAVRRAG